MPGTIKLTYRGFLLPNIPDLKTAIIYPGMCLFEGTNISEGRGTPNPFKWIGAPWIDGKKLSQTLNNFKLPALSLYQKLYPNPNTR